MGLFQYLDTGALDNALVLIQDYVIFQIGTNLAIVKHQVGTYLKEAAGQKIAYTLSDIETAGDVPKFALRSDGVASATGGDSAIVIDGKTQDSTFE